MARRRLTPAQPGYLAPDAGAAHRPAAQVAPIAQVSGQSAEAAALKEMVDGIQAARDEGRMIVEVPLTDIAPAHLVRDRIAFDPEETASLKASIAAYGQRVPAEITPLAAPGDAAAPAYRFGLISGWRRLKALSELHEETGDPRHSTLRAVIRKPDSAAAAYAAMVEENEIRVGLSYYERARIVAEATRAGVFPDQSAALRTMFSAASPAKRSKIASFIDIHERLGDVLGFPAAIPERLGLALVSRLRRDGPRTLRAALADRRPASAKAELALLARLSRPPRPAAAPGKRLGEVIAPGVVLRTEHKGAALTLTLSGEGVDERLLARLRQALQSEDAGRA